MNTKAALAGLLDEPLVVVDVGCRWGLNPVWTGMGDRCVLIGFDPDAEECARLQSLAGPDATARFVPVALGPEAGLATLYMTKDPGGYSVFPSSDDAVGHHPGLDGGRVEQTMVISVTTLDEWCRENGVAGVDVVKLDTQGSELGILEGAAEQLAGVRAIEVEVQFNELYEGVPLFGDVDRFLRRHGFMLWRLKNLAHYAQHGVRTGWYTRDVAHYDEFQSVIRTGSGQLYWADAYFVKAEMARPSPEVGWQQLLRDACIADSLGFHDLVALEIHHARASAPPAVVGQLDQILAADQERHRALALPDRHDPQPATARFDLGRLDIEGWGWGDAQPHAAGGLRWTGPSRDASVDIPAVVEPGTRLELLAVASMSPAILDTLVVELDRVAVPLTPSPHEFGVLFVGVVPAEYRSRRPFTRMVVRTTHTVPWNAVHPDSDDDTELGVAVAWVRLTAPDSR